MHAVSCPPFYPGPVLMRTDDRGIDPRVLVIGVFRQMLENPLPDAAFAPACVACMDHPEVPDPLRQVSPRHAGTVPVYHRFDDPPVLLGRPANMPFAPGQEILDPLPLVVT